MQGTDSDVKENHDVKENPAMSFWKNATRKDRTAAASNCENGGVYATYNNNSAMYVSALMSEVFIVQGEQVYSMNHPGSGD